MFNRQNKTNLGKQPMNQPTQPPQAAPFYGRASGSPTTYSTPDPEVGKNPNARVKLLSRLTAGMAAVTLVSVGFGGFSLVSTSAQKAELNDSAKATVVAKKPITAGTTITADMLEVVQVPAKYRSSDAVETMEALVNHQAAAEIASGSQVNASSVIGSETAQQLSHRIDKDKVAITIESTTASGLAGQLTIGDKVDVVTYETVVSASDESVDEKTQCSIVVENAKVAALGGKSSDVDSEYASVTLEVTEDEAKKIKEASQDSVDIVLKPTVTQTTKTMSNTQSGTSTQNTSAESANQAVSTNGK